MNSVKPYQAVWGVPAGIPTHIDKVLSCIVVIVNVLKLTIEEALMCFDFVKP